MRGGRSSRGRGGRGRGEEQRNQGMVTRSGADKGDLGELTKPTDERPLTEKNELPQQHATPENCTSESDSEEDESDLEIKEELFRVKAQLLALNSQITKLGLEKNQTLGQKLESLTASMEEEFPRLEGTRETEPKTTSPLIHTSWKDKVSSSASSTGMTLKFVPPIIENGVQVVQIESCNVADMIRMWERAVVVYAVGGTMSLDVI